MGEHMEMRPSYRKATQPVINPASTGGIEDAYLRVSGFYFSGREAVSFNADGFIGIAGWADDTNVQPFLRALMRWAQRVDGMRTRGTAQRDCRPGGIRCRTCLLGGGISWDFQRTRSGKRSGGADRAAGHERRRT